MSQCGKKYVTKSKKVTTEKYFQETENTIQVLWDNSVPRVNVMILVESVVIFLHFHFNEYGENFKHKTPW